MKRISMFRLAVLSFVVLSASFAAQAITQLAASDVTFTGLVTCSQCTNLIQRKGFTRWSWAMYKVSQGDGFIFLTQGKAYKLQGDRQQLTRYVEDKATVSGHLDVNTITVTSIVRPTKEK